MKKLTDFLEQIGQEFHDTAFVDSDGNLRPITKDEQLAREIWARALGSEQDTKNTDGSKTHRIFLPDPKAQQFIFERREGKFVTPVEERSITLLERISEVTKAQLNKTAEQIVDDDSLD